MQKDAIPTTVIFRVFRPSKCQNPYHPNYAKGHEVIALFPYQIETSQGDVMSYMHVGQHSAASIDVISDTKLATPEQYTDLKAELENLGYLLDIKKRMSYKKWNEARKVF